MADRNMDDGGERGGGLYSYEGGMLTEYEIMDRFRRLEAELENERLRVKPLVDLFNASRLLGKILFILGGIAVGAATVWTGISGWVSHHVR